MQASDSGAGGGGGRAPRAPDGPPGHTVFGAGSAAASAGAASGIVFAILICFAAVAVHHVRPHRLRFIALEPAGFSSPQQRPG